ncbi:MAG: MFS transporter [Gammaproteobacteria bacterium]
MFKSILSLSSLLIGVALLLTGHGLQLALVPLRAEFIGWTSIDIGYLSSVYFIGFITGCFIVPQVVSRVGHIRTFASMTAIMTATVLGVALTDSFIFWLLLRFISGLGIVGLYLVIESWLNSQVSNEVRGSVLAAYTAIVLAGLALGQLLLNLAPPEGDQLFIIAGILIVLAALPVCLTRSSQPQSIPSARFSPRLVLKTSRAAVVGALIAGLVSGSFYGLGPVYGLQTGMNVFEISIMMSLAIAGGALFQFPIGRMSDRFDRRRVIFAALVLGAIMAGCALLVPTHIVPYIMFAFGAAVMPIYALSLAHASDFAEPGTFLEVGTGLQMLNGVGSIIGPLATSQLMFRIGADLFFVSLAIILLLGAMTILVLIRLRDRQSDHVVDFAPATTAAGQGALQMDPRSDDEDLASDGLANEDSDDEVFEGTVLPKDESDTYYQD